MNHEKLYSRHQEASKELSMLDTQEKTVLHAIKKANASIKYGANMQRAELAVRSAEAEAHEENDKRDKDEEQDLIAFSWNRGPVAADRLTDGIPQKGVDSVKALDTLFEKLEDLDDQTTLPEYMHYQDGSLIVNGVYSDTERQGYIGAEGITYLISGVRQARISKKDSGYSINIFETEYKPGKKSSVVKRKFMTELGENLLRNRARTDYARYASLLDHSSIQPVGEPILTADVNQETAGGLRGHDDGMYFHVKINRILHGEMPKKYKGGRQDLNVGLL
jgi:hypothetical protein